MLKYIEYFFLRFSDYSQITIQQNYLSLDTKTCCIYRKEFLYIVFLCRTKNNTVFRAVTNYCHSVLELLTERHTVYVRYLKHIENKKKGKNNHPPQVEIVCQA